MGGVVPNVSDPRSVECHYCEVGNLVFIVVWSIPSGVDVVSQKRRPWNGGG